jgi:hypothetical protein
MMGRTISEPQGATMTSKGAMAYRKSKVEFFVNPQRAVVH